jgi:DAK2 domain fusion protein YloV
MPGTHGTDGNFDAPTFRRAMSLFLEALREHQDEINSLNVYPVPDGDTGTNLLLTQEAVAAALSAWDGDESSFEAMGEVVSQASLMGARGNSGVILSQVLRGLFGRMPSAGPAGPEDLAAAVEHASDEAFRAVARPAEGTVLTVLRDSARAAREAAKPNATAVAMLDALLAAARDSLARTREIHPDLKRAGVVDAGGKGVVLLFDALRAALRDAPLSEPVGPLGPVGSDREQGRKAVDAGPDLQFEVQYLLEAGDEAVPALRRSLAELGDSLVVVGGGGLFNVHVHTNEPGQAVDAGLGAGEVRNVSIVHLKEQVRACLGSQARAVRVAEQTTALVAVAEGDGLTRTFASLGAVVVPGGPGNNPAVGEILTAIDAAPADDVVVLPNHKNILPAAQRAAAESWKKVRVIPALSIPSGLSSAAAFNPMSGLDENAGSMEEAAASCRWGEITRAERDAETPAGPVRRGEWLGLVEGKAVSVEGQAADAALEVAGRLVAEDSEILTVVWGSDATEEDRRAVEASIRHSFTGLDVQVVQGGQPRSPLLIGVE